MQNSYTQIEIVPDTRYVNAWRVEAIDDDGGIEIAIFDGPRASERAALHRLSYSQPITSKITSLTHV